MAARKIFPAALAFSVAIGVMFGASAGIEPVVDQPEQTRIFRTVDAIVQDRFDATATRQAVLDATATTVAQTVQPPTQTAAFEATVDARFDAAVTATAQVAVLTSSPTPMPSAVVRGASETPEPSMSFRVREGSLPALRECPELTCVVVRNILPGTELTVVSVQGQWFEVVLANGATGFIPSTAVEIPAGAVLPTSLPSPTAQMTPTPQPTSAADFARLTEPRSDGIYSVGVDIAPGRWESTGIGQSCYWARLGRDGDIIDNHFGSAGGEVLIRETDEQVEFVRCGQIEFINGRDRPILETASDPKPDGMYTVGVEIVAGAWRSQPGFQNCYWALLNDQNGIIDNHFGNSGGIVRVGPDVYEVEWHGCGEFVLEGNESMRPPAETVATEFAVGVPFNGFLDGTRQTFPLPADAGEAFLVTLSSEDFDSYLEVVDDGNVLTFNDDAGRRSDSRIVFVAPRSRTFSIIVRPFRTGRGAFSLLAQPSAGILEVGQSIALDIDGVTPHLYQVDPSVTGSHTLAVETERSVLFASVDTNLTIFDGSGAQVAFADDTRGLDPAVESFDFGGDGPYFVLIAPYNQSAVGDVSLTIQRQ